LLQGNFHKAVEFFQRATSLWLLSGKKDRWAEALNNQAIAKAELGEDVEVIFEEALRAVENSATSKAMVLQNKARSYAKRNDMKRAEQYYLEAAELAQQVKADTTESAIRTNLGVIYHQQGIVEFARFNYERALELARPSGNTLYIASILSNLGELNLDLLTIEEALRLLKIDGHDAAFEEAQLVYDSVKQEIENSMLAKK
jgi:tetratricopeptide (TPR) repeat protein